MQCVLISLKHTIKTGINSSPSPTKKNQSPKSGSGTSSKAVWASSLYHQGSRLLQFLNAHAWPNHRQRCLGYVPPTLTYETLTSRGLSCLTTPHSNNCWHTLNVGRSLGPTQIPWELVLSKTSFDFSQDPQMYIVIATNASIYLKRTTKFGASGFCSSMLIHFGGHGLSHPRHRHRMDKALLQAPRTPSQDRSQAPLRTADFRLQHFQNLQQFRGNCCFKNPRIPLKFWRDGNCLQSSEEMLITLATTCVFGRGFQALEIWMPTFNSTSLGRFSAILCTKGM